MWDFRDAQPPFGGGVYTLSALGKRGVRGLVNV